MTERELTLVKIMNVWDAECPDAESDIRDVAIDLFASALQDLDDDQLHDLQKVMLDA